MRSRFLRSVLALGIVLLFAVSGVQATSNEESEFHQRRIAVDLLRAINTAEIAYRTQSRGSFGDWSDISATQQFKNALERLSHAEPALKNANLASPDSLLPGWKLRLVLSGDRKSYAVMVINTADECSYALISDQEGVIREGRVTGCGPRKFNEQRAPSR